MKQVLKPVTDRKGPEGREASRWRRSARTLPGLACWVGLGLVGACGSSGDPSQQNSTLRAAPLGLPILDVAKGRDLAVMVDPERSALRFVDLKTRRVSSLQLGTEEAPEAVEAGTDWAYVLAGGTGEVLQVSLETEKVERRAFVCDAPSGLVESSDGQTLTVVCGGGELISLDPQDLSELRKVMLPSNLRDVAEFEDGLVVSRFRSAELLLVDAEGHVTATVAPQVDAGAGQPNAAWRMRVVDDTIYLLHQFSSLLDISTEPGGYGNSFCGGQIVTPALSVFRRPDAIALSDGETGVQPPPGYSDPNDALWAYSTVLLFGVTGALDFVVTPTGSAQVIAPGNAWAPHRRSPLISVDGFPLGVSVDSDACSASDGLNSEGGGPSASPPPSAVEPPVGIALASSGKTLLQSRQSATLTVLGEEEPIRVATPAAEQLGQRLFHMSTDSVIACVSCHPGGGDDGHTWSFQGIGLRRTQSLLGGVSQKAPFHWDGEFTELNALMSDVFVERMGLEREPSAAEVSALRDFLDGLPPAAHAGDRGEAPNVARGQALFHDAELACASCHSGAGFSDGKLYDVGTGGSFITPELVGLATRAPYMHDGCASDLKARFGACGGGDLHGKTSQLSGEEIDALVAYLLTL